MDKNWTTIFFFYIKSLFSSFFFNQAIKLQDKTKINLFDSLTSLVIFKNNLKLSE